jgi:hypothetical protein
VWDTLDAAWEEKFSELKVFKDIKGHCKVPKRWTENPQLGRWVINQRSARREGKLSDERIQRLSEIGFVWEMKDI